MREVSESDLSHLANGENNSSWRRTQEAAHLVSKVEIFFISFFAVTPNFCGYSKPVLGFHRPMGHAFHMPPRERKSLLQILWSRLRREPLPEPKTAVAPRPFQAISIYCGTRSCAVARRFRDHRFLAKDAPQLPLTGCTMPTTCECRYLKHKDRRAERRRFVDFASARRDFGQERRQRRGRRGTD